MIPVAKRQSLRCLCLAVIAAAAVGCGGEGSKPVAGKGGSGGSARGGTGGQVTGGSGGMVVIGAGGSGGGLGGAGGAGGNGGAGGGSGRGGIVVGLDAGDATTDVGTPDGSTDVTIDGGADGGACQDSKGCPEGKQCNLTTKVCESCTTDATCKADVSYGAQFLCLAGNCVRGDCHDTSLECSAGQVCGVAKVHTCGQCTADSQCTADARYGAGFICQADGKCAKGDCATSANCSGTKEGLLCGPTLPNTCGSCTQDSQCKNDAKYKDNQSLCFTAAGPDSGRCVVNTCPTNGQRCAANAADFCCGNKCVPGNCCDGDDTPCKVMGANFTCVKNTCTACDAVAGNQYFVDPERGNDLNATGSGKAAGAASSACMFRTITRVLDILPDVPPVDTVITIVGNAGRITDLLVVAPSGQTVAVERLPIDLSSTTRVTTKDGPIRLKLPAAKVGFQFLGPGSSLVPDPAAPLSIDGQGISGTAVAIAAANSTISNVTVENTGDDGLRVRGGTGIIGPGVRVTKSGTAAARQSGLEVTGGLARIEVGAGLSPSSFDNNSENGISVVSRGELDITGKPTGAPAEGKGTVVVSGNANAGIHVAQDVTFAGRGTNGITGVVAFSNQGAGLRILGGSRVKLRGSVLIANGGSGVLVEPSALSAAGNDISAIDLGAAGDPGLNILQTLLGQNPNNGAGLCVDLDVGRGALTLRARGNTFAGVGAALDCAATPAPTTPIVRDTTCGRSNLGVVPAVGTTVTVELNGCTVQ